MKPWNRLTNRIAASAIHRLGLPFAYVNPETPLEGIQRELTQRPRYTPGEVIANGWTLNYVDALALHSCLDVIVMKRWNDFVAKREAPFILDCGANIGITVLHYKQLYPKARIVAFEPDKEICAVLRQNLAANNVNDVEVLETAVWTANGKQTFLSEGADGSRLTAQSSGAENHNEYSVSTVRLADYLDDEPVDFIKLDIEGAESEVLADCGARLRNVDSMAIEFHLMNNAPQGLAAAFKVLTEAGFNLSVNSYGPWVDLARPPEKKSAGDLSFDQYLLVCAWRP